MRNGSTGSYIAVGSCSLTTPGWSHVSWSTPLRCLCSPVGRAVQRVSAGRVVFFSEWVHHYWRSPQGVREQSSLIGIQWTPVFPQNTAWNPGDAVTGFVSTVSVLCCLSLSSAFHLKNVFLFLFFFFLSDMLSLSFWSSVGNWQILNKLTRKVSIQLQTWLSISFPECFQGVEESVWSCLTQNRPRWKKTEMFYVLKIVLSFSTASGLAEYDYPTSDKALLYEYEHKVSSEEVLHNSLFLLNLSHLT